MFYANDVGTNGSLWTNSGGVLVPVGPITLYTSTDSYSRAPTGTINTGSSGNITFGTAANRTYTEGLYVYLPSIATTPAITAGFYWCVMSSTTVGTLYASKGGAAINFTVGAGYTGVTSSVDLPAQTLKGGVMGGYRRLSISGILSVTNNANAKLHPSGLAGRRLVLRHFKAQLVAFQCQYSKQDGITTTPPACNIRYGCGIDICNYNQHGIRSDIQPLPVREVGQQQQTGGLSIAGKPCCSRTDDAAMNTAISSVNTTLNNSVGYRASPDRWEAADIGGTGDCKAIALGKQIRLSAAGFDTGLCTVATPSGEGHCVLCVREGNEWWVLDNLTPDTSGQQRRHTSGI